MKSITTAPSISIKPTELPGDGRSVFYFPNPHLGGGKADVVYRISPSAGAPWYAALADGRVGLRDRAFVMPDRKSVFVDGYVVRAGDPMDWHRIQLDSVSDCGWTVSGDHVVFLDLHGIAVYGRWGLCWLHRNHRHMYLRRLVGVVDGRIIVEGAIDEDVVGKFPAAFSLWDGSQIHDSVVQHGRA